MNSLYQQLGAMSQPMSNIKQMFNLLKMSGNPNAVLNKLMEQNPQIMELIKQSGGDPKAAFYNLAKQKGVDPNQILNMFR